MIREWEVEGRRALPPERKTLSDCWKDFLADVEARKLHESTTRKYKVLKRQMEGYAKQRASFLSTNLIYLPLACFVPNGKTVNVRARKNWSASEPFSALHRNGSGCLIIRRVN
jgi:hypothetical protein